LIAIPKIRSIVASPLENQLSFATNISGNFSVHIKVGESGSYLAYCSTNDSYPITFLSPMLLSVMESGRGVMVDLSRLSVKKLPSPAMLTHNNKLILRDGTILSEDLREEGKLDFIPWCKVGDHVWGLRDGKVVSESGELTEGEELACSDSSLYIRRDNTILSHQGGTVREIAKDQEILGLRAQKGRMLFFNENKVSVFDEPFKIFREVKTEHTVIDATTSPTFAYVLMEGYNLPPTILKFDPRSPSLQRFHSQILGSIEPPNSFKIGGREVLGYVRGDGFLIYVGRRRWSPLFHEDFSVLFLEDPQGLDEVSQWAAEKGKVITMGHGGESLEEPEDFREYVKYVEEMKKKLSLTLGIG
jgi:hypothetical protein